jgi:hypothetical protein
MTQQGSDVVVNYVAAESRWHEVSNHSPAETADDVATAAQDYVTAIEAYLAVLRATGRRIPSHLVEVASGLRTTYGDAPVACSA